MSNRQQIDSVIDDDDEFCPLCIEEFDLSDKNFKPCPCGYQICQFCYNNIKTHSEEGRCPNCRRVYDESTIQYKVPDADEFKADLALKHRKAAAAKKKEAEKREIEASSRKNLAGVRVVQKNLVYVIGLNPTIRDESQLLQTLRGRDYFGQYGDIEKIVVSKAKPGGNPNQGIGVYVTYARKVDAATCINSVDGSVNGDRILRAQYGTTKYCSSFLRNEQCHNRNCTFLHETGEDSDSYSRQDLSSMNTLSSQRSNGLASGPGSALPPHIARSSAQPISQTLRRQPSKDDAGGRPLDGSALPSSASWANKDPAINRTRRASLTGSQSSQSPRSVLATVETPADDSKRREKQSTHQQQERSPTSSQSDVPSSAPPTTRRPAEQDTPLLDNLVKSVNSPSFKFVFSTASLPADELALIENHPSFIDPYGGVKRRAMRVKAEQERAKREQELLQSAAAEDEGRESGSLQLGGEPDDANPPRGRVNRESHGAIQPPSQHGTTESSAVGSPVSAAGHQFQGINLSTRSLTPLQQQQLMLFKSSSNQQASLVDPSQSGINSAAFDQATQTRQGLLQSQVAQLNALQAQNRQNSRFSFNDASTKNLPNSRMLNQQMSLLQSGTPNPLAAPSPQHTLGGSFYTSGVQGPPPGLKTAGTPPISGGGMFAQGHGFTSNTGLGGLSGKQEANPELMRELLRSRGGTNASGLQGQDNKLDLADPSILQARMHQVGANAVAGQGLYGSQGQVDEEFPPLGAITKDKRSVDSFGSLMRSQLVNDSQPLGRSGTPSLPPGLPLPQTHATSALFQDQLKSPSPISSVSVAPPGFDIPSPSVAESQAFKDDVAGLESKGVPERKSSRSKNAAQISLGSPVAKPAAGVRSQQKEQMSSSAEKTSLQKAVGPNETKGPSPADARAKPMKLDMSFNTPQFPEITSKTEPSGSSTQPSVPSAAVGSRPNTPMTGVSRTSDSPAPRQPRVLRVVDTPKAETPPPVSATQSVASFPTNNKVRSRRPSISSQSRPDTPGDLGSEADLYTSTSASRANSPPASSRIGSAPVRSITKSQLKKERKQKAKDAEAKKQEVASVSEEPMQAPIIGRKRKTKKAPAEAPNPPPENLAASNLPPPSNNEESEKTEPVKKLKSSEAIPIKETEPASSERKASIGQKEPEPWRTKNTVEQLLKDAESSGVPLKELFAERTSPLQVLLSQLHKSGALDLNHHPLFNPSNLNLRFDMKCTSDDYEDLKQPIELTEQHRKALLRGEPVRFASDPNSLKDRCLITPRGCILHHLSPEEEDRYLALEKSIYWAIDAFQEYPAIPITEPDATNRGGGLDALFATPENFNVCWVDEISTAPSDSSPTSALSPSEEPLSSAPPNVLSAMEADSTRSHNWAIANTAEIMNATATSVRTFAAATAKHMLGAAGVVMGNLPDLDDVVGMTDEELRSFAIKSQKELESSRKELDAIDKKLSALVKRNKKLAQQALAT
ncbi:CCR4-NOT core ubiquitin-protein ligase subunit MOT2 [Aspergillus lucknowensis]|uniref:RING-type domain-containing protein n=1 Tax=Aspergillus lucknowensis TaxID=176173 RepID=A0ABR4M0F0_9EURO